MGAWYTIGIFVGIGAALGVACTAVLVRLELALLVSVALAAILGYVFSGWEQVVGGALGAVLGSLGTAPIVAGTLRRGGTRGGTAAILLGAAVVIAALAFVPALGYVEAVAIPLVGLRLRRRAPDRHAGLRTLAKD
jgi:hypothetical protein